MALLVRAAAAASGEIRQVAPVLTVPNVLSPADCRALIARWSQGRPRRRQHHVRGGWQDGGTIRRRREESAAIISCRIRRCASR
jgi:hypothetical protein